MSMDVVPADALDDATIDQFVDDASGWFWHGSRWRRYALAYSQAHLVADVSFGIMRDGALVAWAPAYVESREATTVLYAGGPAPTPLIAPSVSARARKDIMNEVVGSMMERARTHGADAWHGQETHLQHPALGAGLGIDWLATGAAAVPAYTRMLRLDSDGPSLAGVRKGHRAAIKRAEKEIDVTLAGPGDDTAKAAGAFEHMHIADAGRRTRSSDTFAMMGDWAQDGHAIIALAHKDGQPVAGAIALVHRAGAYYASACREPDALAEGAHHLLQWRLIQELARVGIKSYDLGAQYPDASLQASAKQRSIAAFKAGFGGLTLYQPLLRWSVA